MEHPTKPKVNGNKKGIATDPITWTFEFKKTSFNTYRFKAIANIETIWRLYSPKTTWEGIQPTSITFDKSNLPYPKGGLQEIGDITRFYDDLQNKEAYYYEDWVIYIQDFTVFTKPQDIKGQITYTPYTEKTSLPTKVMTFDVRPDE